MFLKLWRKYLQLFLAGTLVAWMLQSCSGILHRQQANQQTLVVPSECRMVQHERGKSCIPLHPKRVIVMDQESLEILVALDLKPIAATTSNRVGNKTRILQNKVGEIITLGKEGQPNLERIVQLNPDLIVGLFISPQIYKLLSQVAPTVSIEYSQTDWKKTLQQVAEIVDRTSTANNLLRAYQQRIQMIREQLMQQTGKLKISVMRFYTDAHLTQFLNQNSFAIHVLEELGVLSIPENQRQQIQIPNSDWGYVNVSLEHIPWLEADVMFVAVDPGAEASLRLYAESPLWRTLKVVQRNQVYAVDSGYWIFGNILSAHAILDDVLKHLVQ